MKPIAWVLLLALASIMVWADTLLPKPGDPLSATVFHVSPRYAESSAAETGLSRPLPAVMADYRGFDLLSLTFLFFLAALFILAPLGVEEPGPGLLPIALPWAGAALGILLGFYGMRDGGNFLDYEPLSRWISPIRTRGTGMAVLSLGFLGALTGALLSFLGAIRRPGGGAS